MENRYDKVMKNIEVTADMRNRILNNMNNLNLNKIPNKIIPFHNYKKYLSIAACFVFLLVGSLIIHNTSSGPNEPPLLVGPKIVDHSTIDELSEAVGFPVKELQNIPFDVDTMKFTSLCDDLAEVTYEGQSNTAVLRMAPHNEDISGDYSEYTSIKNDTINGHEITLKGNNGKYNLGVWQSDGFSYAVHFSEAVSEQEILITIESLQ